MTQRHTDDVDVTGSGQGDEDGSTLLDLKALSIAFKEQFGHLAEASPIWQQLLGRVEAGRQARDSGL